MRTLAVIVLFGSVASGCIRLSRTVAQLPEGEWTTRLGDAAHAPFIREHVPQSVTVDWEADLGRGLPVAPIVQHDLIVSAVSGGGVVAVDARNGERYWSRRFNGAVAGQVIRVGPRIHFATQHRNGTLYTLDLDRGRRAWSRRLGSRAAAEPVYADGRIYLGTHTELQAIDAANGSIIWRRRLTGPPVQPPIIVGDDLLIAVRDTLFRIGRDDGMVRGRAGIAGEPSAPLALRGDTLVIAMHPGIVAAYVDAGAR
ncbi:MAG: PQQ-binding-like beta-propeller repeat protein, partial [Longimicrobiales bacterium]